VKEEDGVLDIKYTGIKISAVTIVNCKRTKQKTRDHTLSLKKSFQTEKRRKKKTTKKTKLQKKQKKNVFGT